MKKMKTKQGYLYIAQSDGKFYVEFFVPLKIFEMSYLELHEDSIEWAKKLNPVRGHLTSVNYTEQDGKAVIV